MREDEAIKFLETLEVGTFLTVNIPISPNKICQLQQCMQEKIKMEDMNF